MLDIIKKYDHFILDLWGVVHNGQQLLPHVDVFLKALEEGKKNYCFLSNAPRPRHVALKKLHELGLVYIDIERVTTSGDLFREKISDYSQDQIYVIGEEKNQDILAGLKVKQSNNIEKSDYVLMLSFCNSEEELMGHNAVLEKAAKIGIPMLCPNPDIIVHSGGQTVYTPGAYARIYENMGGKVHYFGKPHKEAYDAVFSRYDMKPQKTIMIGDSLETDIRGAKNAGIDSILLLTGVHGQEKELEKLYKRYNVLPTYTLNNLGFKDG